MPPSRSTATPPWLKVRTLTAEAARTGAKLVLFPEAFLSAYPKGVTFGVHVGSRSDEGRRLFQAYWDSAVDVPGPACDELAAIAREHAVLAGDRRDRARGRHTLLHRLVLRPGRNALGEAPQAHAHGHGADHLGRRRWLDAARVPDRGGAGGRRDLLGELHAAPPCRHVRQEYPALLRADRRRPRGVAVDHAPHRRRGALLRAQAPVSSRDARIFPLTSIPCREPPPTPS
jgi:hypothetical protein